MSKSPMVTFKHLPYLKQKTETIFLLKIQRTSSLCGHSRYLQLSKKACPFFTTYFFLTYLPHSQCKQESLLIEQLSEPTCLVSKRNLRKVLEQLNKEHRDALIKYMPLTGQLLHLFSIFTLYIVQERFRNGKFSNSVQQTISNHHYVEINQCLLEGCFQSYF